MPTDAPVEVKSVSNGPRQITVEAGNRQTMGEVVERLRKRVNRVSRRS
ncbi:hypothetical protein [Halorussus sp. MSC15.2]|nr:hypothetical protein [Halorussus sp. MSC15.2]NEU57096.1 hypothetical protein [Halorussus sp. MSC15.2]